MFVSRESGGFEESIDGSKSLRSPSVKPKHAPVCTHCKRGYSSPVTSNPSSSQSKSASQGGDDESIRGEAAHA